MPRALINRHLSLMSDHATLVIVTLTELDIRVAPTLRPRRYDIQTDVTWYWMKPPASTHTIPTRLASSEHVTLWNE